MLACLNRNLVWMAPCVSNELCLLSFLPFPLCVFLCESVCLLCVCVCVVVVFCVR